MIIIIIIIIIISDDGGSDNKPSFMFILRLQAKYPAVGAPLVLSSAVRLRTSWQLHSVEIAPFYVYHRHTYHFKKVCFQTSFGGSKPSLLHDFGIKISNCSLCWKCKSYMYQRC